MDRKTILEMVEKCVCEDRNFQYGEPENSFALIAEFWNSFLCRKHGVESILITPKDVAALMCLLKLARLANDPNKLDSWVDLAGYAVCGGELANG